jgi:hypothetical protein
MKYSILIHDLALSELKEAVLYYEDLVPLLGEKLLNEFNEVVRFMEVSPLMFQQKFDQYRQIKLKKFPYFVVYKTEGDVIAVYRFFHAKRRPIKKNKQ